MATLGVTAVIVIASWFAAEIARNRQNVIRINARSRLQHLAFGLRNYRIDFGQLPSLVTEAGDGNQRRSWRVEIARYVEQPSQWPYDESLPWGSAENVKAAELVKSRFQADDVPIRSTNVAQIVAIDIPDGPWHGPFAADRKHWPLLVLIPESRIELLEPRDVSIEELMKLSVTRSRIAFPIYISSLDGEVRELSVTELSQFEVEH